MGGLTVASVFLMFYGPDGAMRVGPVSSKSVPFLAWIGPELDSASRARTLRASRASGDATHSPRLEDVYLDVDEIICVEAKWLPLCKT